MGFTDGRLVLDRPSSTYSPGETVHGKLCFSLENAEKCKGLYIKIDGFCKVHWTTSRSDNGVSVSVSVSDTTTVHHSATEDYINLKICLIDNKSRGDIEIDPGDYDYPFSFNIPEECPSSYESTKGHIRYIIKAVYESAKTEEKMIMFRVCVPIILDKNSYKCQKPLEMDFSSTFCCFCFCVGSIDVVVVGPHSSFSPGDRIPAVLTLTKKGYVGINNITMQIIKVTSLFASDRTSTTETEIIATKTNNTIPRSAEHKWAVEIEVPKLELWDISKCKIMKSEYRLQAVVIPSGCHMRAIESCGIELGMPSPETSEDNTKNKK